MLIELQKGKRQMNKKEAIERIKFNRIERRSMKNKIDDK